MYRNFAMTNIKTVNRYIKGEDKNNLNTNSTIVCLKILVPFAANIKLCRTLREL